MAHNGNGDLLTKAMIVLVVFPTSLLVFAMLLQWPLVLVVSLLPVGGTVGMWITGVIAYGLGVAGAVWTCRFAWPRSHGHPAAR